MCVFFSSLPNRSANYGFQKHFTTKQVFCLGRAGKTFLGQWRDYCFHNAFRWTSCEATCILRGFSHHLGRQKRKLRNVKKNKYSWCKQNTQASNRVTEFSIFAYKLTCFHIIKKKRQKRIDSWEVLISVCMFDTTCVLPVHPAVSNQHSQLECCHVWPLGWSAVAQSHCPKSQHHNLRRRPVEIWKGWQKMTLTENCMKSYSNSLFGWEELRLIRTRRTSRCD